MAEHHRWILPAPGPAEAAAGLLAGAAGRAVAPIVRAALHGELHKLFRGDADAELPMAMATPEDPGWFGPDSVTWRVHADASMFVAGIASLAFQALHPLAMAGVADHSDFQVDPLGRLRRTASFVGVTAYGSSAQAAQLCAVVRRVHERVVGHTPDGRPYAANDPELLDWVHVAEFAMIAAAHRRFGAAPMTDAELDQYVAEVSRIGIELGDPSPPRSWADLDAALERHRPNLCVNEQSRSAWNFLEKAHRVLPPPAGPAYQLLWSGAVACLPPWARRLWGVSRPSTAELAACRALVRGIGAMVGDPPRMAEARARAA